jgi:hypothetical protein
MVKLVVAVSAAILLGLLTWFLLRPEDAGATPCERDCINDSGGKAFCADYCRQHGTYGPATR